MYLPSLPPHPIHSFPSFTEQLRLEKARVKRDLADDPADNADGLGWVRNTLAAVIRDVASETRALRLLHAPDMRTPAQRRKDVEARAAGGASAIAVAADAVEALSLIHI